MNVRHAFCLRLLRRRMVPVVLPVAVASLLVACAEEREPYPDIITEMADIHTDHTGRLCDMLTDDGRHYAISNTNIALHRPDTVYRAVAGFVPEQATASSSPLSARIYALTAAQVLADSTAVVRHDPTGIESMWAEGSYINMQLTAKSQGGIHRWGYAVDSWVMAGIDGRRSARHYLSVHHVQGTDPQSYSTTWYCSIAVPAIPQYQAGDTVTVTVHTFTGAKSWTFLP